MLKYFSILPKIYIYINKNNYNKISVTSNCPPLYLRSKNWHDTHRFFNDNGLSIPWFSINNSYPIKISYPMFFLYFFKSNREFHHLFIKLMKAHINLPDKKIYIRPLFFHLAQIFPPLKKFKITKFFPPSLSEIFFISKNFDKISLFPWMYLVLKFYRLRDFVRFEKKVLILFV